MPVWSTGLRGGFSGTLWLRRACLTCQPVGGIWRTGTARTTQLPLLHGLPSPRRPSSSPSSQWHEERGLICGFDQQGQARAGYPIQERTTVRGLPSHPALVHRPWKRSPWRGENPFLAGSPVRPTALCGSRLSIVRAGEARWKRPSTGCCPGYVQAPTSTIPMPCTTALAAGGGSGLPRRRTGDNRTGSTITCLPRRSAASARF